MRYFAAHDDLSVFAVSNSRSEIEGLMETEAGKIGVDILTFEYQVTECSKVFHDYVKENGTPDRWMLNDGVLKLPEELDDDED